MPKYLIALTLITLVACRPPVPKKAALPEKIENWKTADDPDFGMQYPGDWELNQTGMMGTRLVLLASRDGDDDRFRENVNILTEDLPRSGIGASEYGKASESQIKSAVSNCEIIESKTVNGSYYRLVYNGDNQGFHLRYMQYYFVGKKKAWVLTFTCEQRVLSNYEETGEKILNSFYLK